ncbi:synaptosomal-associated protein 25-like [Xenia sp. Carnegie-2017]|uniref:synaptosomal-associated protein 25-like n=1 Tax=Xenia sp. Carnegie-2017 TaxID=2897299 RepID=UPI001F049E56|nr:synaptosomal-associated protein 25-like [Xenia sp. Carnegie-2017]
MASWAANERKYPSEDDLDDYEYDTVVSKLEQTQNRVLGSTSRSLGLIEESHDIAIKTAEELQRQEESLNRTERNLDNISRDVGTANRHIKSVQSIWGAIGNYFSKPKESTIAKHEKEKSIVEETTLNHSTELRLDYAEKDVLPGYDSPGQGTESFEKQYDTHLSEISRGLSILKDDALVLGQTIDRHNDIITRIEGKVERVDDEVGLADKKIRRILGK